MAVKHFTSAIAVTAWSSVRGLDRVLMALGTGREASLRRVRGTNETRQSVVVLVSITIISNEIVAHLPDLTYRRSEGASARIRHSDPRPSVANRQTVLTTERSAGSLSHVHSQITIGQGTGALTGVADGSNLIDFGQEGVTATAQMDRPDVPRVSGRVTLTPVSTSEPRPEGHSSLLQGASKHLTAHPPRHEDLT